MTDTTATPMPERIECGCCGRQLEQYGPEEWRCPQCYDGCEKCDEDEMRSRTWTVETPSGTVVELFTCVSCGNVSSKKPVDEQTQRTCTACLIKTVNDVLPSSPGTPLTYEQLKEMAEKSPILKAIMEARFRYVAAIHGPPNSGFTIKPKCACDPVIPGQHTTPCPIADYLLSDASDCDHVLALSPDGDALCVKCHATGFPLSDDFAGLAAADEIEATVRKSERARVIDEAAHLLEDLAAASQDAAPMSPWTTYEDAAQYLRKTMGGSDTTTRERITERSRLVKHLVGRRDALSEEWCMGGSWPSKGAMGPADIERQRLYDCGVIRSELSRLIGELESK